MKHMKYSVVMKHEISFSPISFFYFTCEEKEFFKKMFSAIPAVTATGHQMKHDMLSWVNLLISLGLNIIGNIWVNEKTKNDIFIW